MSSQPVDRLHPVLDFAHRLRERLDSIAKVPLWSMTEEQQRNALTTLTHAQAQLDALKLGLLAEADRSGATTETGAGTAADWIAVETRQVRREARSDLRLAEALERHDMVSAAMARVGSTPPRPARSWPRSTSCPPRESSRSTPNNEEPPRHIWWRWPSTTTPKHSGSWAAGSSR